MHIGVIAGEVSGDKLAASLLFTLQSRFSNLRVTGILGPACESLGYTSLVPMERLSVMGFWEPLKRLPELWGIRRQMLAHFLSDPPDFFLGIDSPEFNLSIEKKLKAHGIRTIHAVSPSVWAWRAGRIKTIQKAVDLMLVLFPFEVDFYEQHKVPVALIGHPFADQIPLDINEAFAKQNLGYRAQDCLVALLPGSRQAEIERMMPLYLETAKLLQQVIPDIQFLTPVVSKVQAERVRALREQIAPMLPLRVLVEGMRPCLAAADIALVTSGTATLETLLHQKPMVVAYRLNSVTHALLKRLVKVPYIALPNLLSQSFLVPEFIQSAATPKTCADQLLALLNQSPTEKEQLKQQFQYHHRQLQQETGLCAYYAMVSQGIISGSKDLK